jgi:hypothetical protein
VLPRLPFLFSVSIKAIIRPRSVPFKLLPFLPFPYPLYIRMTRRPSMARPPAATPPSASPSLSLALLKPCKSLCPPLSLSRFFSQRPCTNFHPRRRLCFAPPLEMLAAGEGFSFPPLFSLSCVAPIAHRTSFAPGSRPRRFGELRPCLPECRPSSPLPPNSANAASPPSIFSAVASLQGKKAAAPSFPSGPCTWLCGHGEPSPPAVPLAMVASSLAGPYTCGHGHVCFYLSIVYSRLACQSKARTMISLVAAARRRAIVRHQPRHLVTVICDISPPPVCVCMLSSFG